MSHRTHLTDDDDDDDDDGDDDDNQSLKHDIFKTKL